MVGDRVAITDWLRVWLWDRSCNIVWQVPKCLGSFLSLSSSLLSSMEREWLVLLQVHTTTLRLTTCQLQVHRILSEESLWSQFQTFWKELERDSLTFRSFVSRCS